MMEMLYQWLFDIGHILLIICFIVSLTYHKLVANKVKTNRWKFLTPVVSICTGILIIMLTPIIRPETDGIINRLWFGVAFGSGVSGLIEMIKGLHRFIIYERITRDYEKKTQLHKKEGK